MVKDILVCLEGSRSSQRATEAAIKLALDFGATLVGLAIVDEPDIRAGQATGIGGTSFKRQRDATLLEDAHEHAQAWADTFTDRCRAAGVAARPLELRGRPAATILEEMERHDLTVLGGQVNFLFETDLHDHQTRDQVLHTATKPVLVVPETTLDSGSAVLVLYDASSASKRALRSFAESGLAQDRPVHVATAGDDGASAYETADRGCAALRELGIKAIPHSVVSVLSIAEAILDQRKKLGAGLLVMGAYAHSRLSHLVWGSVTHELLEKTPVPLFIHR